MLKKTFSRSRLSPDTLDKVKMGVMLQGRGQASMRSHFENRQHIWFFLYVKSCLTLATGQTAGLL